MIGFVGIQKLCMFVSRFNFNIPWIIRMGLVTIPIQTSWDVSGVIVRMDRWFVGSFFHQKKQRQENPYFIYFRSIVLSANVLRFNCWMRKSIFAFFFLSNFLSQPNSLSKFHPNMVDCYPGSRFRL